MESIEEKLQWIKGDKIGSVEVIKTTEDGWTIFESGGRISTSLISEFLEPLDGDPLDFNPPSPASIKAAILRLFCIPRTWLSWHNPRRRRRRRQH